MDDTTTLELDAFPELKSRIRDAAKDSPSFAEFLWRLTERGITFLPKVTKAGRVSNISYRYQGREVKASELGIEYTWSGLKRFGVDFDRDRDFALLTGVAWPQGAPGAKLPPMQSPKSHGVSTVGAPTDAPGPTTTTQKTPSYVEHRAEAVVEKLEELKDIEKRLLNVFEDLRSAGSRQLKEALATLSQNSQTYLSTELKKLQQVESAKIATAINPMEVSVASLRSDVKHMMEQVQDDHKVLHQQSDATANAVKQLLLTGKHLEEAAKRLQIPTQATDQEFSKQVRELGQKLDKIAASLEKSAEGAAHNPIKQIQQQLEQSLAVVQATVRENFDKLRAAAPAGDLLLQLDKRWEQVEKSLQKFAEQQAAAGSGKNEELAKRINEVAGRLDQIVAQQKALMAEPKPEILQAAKALIAAAEKQAELSEKLGNGAWKAVSTAQKAVQNVDEGAMRLRRESFWVSLMTGVVAALLTSMVVGIWISRDVSLTKVAIIEHMDKQVADDPLRAYFNKLIEKLK